MCASLRNDRRSRSIAAERSRGVSDGVKPAAAPDDV